MSHDDPDPAPPELTRLADGTLPADRAAELRAQAERSPQLAAELAAQERAVTLLRALDTPAPATLRARVLAGATHDGERSPAAGADAPGRRRESRREVRRDRRRGRRWLGPGLPALALLAVALVIAVTRGGAGPAPTIPQTARLALAASTRPAPAADPAAPGRLKVANAGIAFPDWERGAGWRATGSRADTLGGHRVVTVFYTSPAGSRVGYGIVAGAPLPAIAGRTVMHYGVRFTLARLGGENLVTWQRAGHTCVIAGRAVGYPVLLGLASADEHAAAT